MSVHLSGASGCVTVLAIVMVPAAVTAYFMGDPKWLVIVAATILLLALFVAALPLKRKVTPEQYASELEAHLLGAEGECDWDDTTSIAISDPRLNVLRSRLHKFDALTLDERQRELAAIIAALKRGEIPEVSDD